MRTEMPDIYREMIVDPSAWTPQDLATDRNWEMTLNDTQAGELVTALQQVTEQGLSLPEITAENFKIDTCASVTSAIREQLRTGRGMALLHNFPVADQSRQDIERMYWGFCAHLGTGVTQNSDSTLIHYATEGKLRLTKVRAGSVTPARSPYTLIWPTA